MPLTFVRWPVSDDWKTTTRYYTFSQFLRETFGCKVHKVSVNAGFGCPNRDGTIGAGGCAYCVNASFSPSAGQAQLSVHEQVARAVARVQRHDPGAKFLAYFQPFTNTYADTATLRARYDEAVSHPSVVGLAIGTRPDCVPDAVLDLVEGYARRMHVWLEYGLQSAHDHTLARMNRGHGWAAFADAVRRTKGRGIRVCAHVILGLPGENRGHMCETAEQVAQAGIDGVKLHHLAIVKGSALEAAYARGEVQTLQCEQYVALAADFLERTPERVVIQRLVGDTYGELLIAPRWPQAKQQVLAAVTAELRGRGSRQGSRRP
jgi:radical SAM protein (TIGR01212 family)